MNEQEALAAMERNAETWANAPEGALAIELWASDPWTYTLMPFTGVLTSDEDCKGWAAVLSDRGIYVDGFAVNVKAGAGWKRQYVWSRKGGFKYV